MSDANDLLKAAKYALHTEKDTDRASALAQEIFGKYPNSEEATDARAMLMEIQKGTFPRTSNPTQRPTAPASPGIGHREVVVADIQISFFRAVGIMVKWALAAIPAMIIVTIIVAIAWGLVVGVIVG